MNEKPTSIWKKSWKGPSGFLLWFIGLFAVAFVIFFVIWFGSAKNNSPFDSIKFATILSLICALFGALLITFIRWLCCWRNLKRLLFAFACLITLLALFYAEENWRGKHAWEKFKRAGEARGEKFDFKDFIPPPVPDDQNFALTPVVASSYEMYFDQHGNDIRPRNTNVIDRLTMVSWRDNPWTNLPYANFEWVANFGWPAAKLVDLKPWQHFFRSPPPPGSAWARTNQGSFFPVAPQAQAPADDVLLALSKFDSTIEELRQASRLLYSRFPLEYGTLPAAILLPHLSALLSSCQTIQLRALAELQNGQTEKALADVELMLRLVAALRTEPFFISHQVRISLLQITLQPVYEGLAGQKWTNPQLKELDLELAKLDFSADLKFIIQGTPAFVSANFDFFQQRDNLGFKHPRLYFLAPMISWVQTLANMSADDGNTMNARQMFILGAGPSGWLDQNELRFAQFNRQWYLPAMEAETISPTKIHVADQALQRERKQPSPENVLIALFMPDLNDRAKRFAYGQTSANLARTAIALERYRLARGKFPETLDVLAPDFIPAVPHDVINGRPLKYRREANGQFTLYSVGWNETDDGGVVVFKKGTSPGVDIDQGDWVWRYPQNK